jgi:hypothetical protein
MSARKLLILTGVVIALFAFIFFYERKMPTTAELSQKGELYWDLPEDRVERIVLEHGGATVELDKSGESWRLVRPDAYPADASAASDLARQLADLKKPAGESPEGARPEDYGLAKPGAKATFGWTEAATPAKKLSRTLELGLDIPGTDLTAARQAGRAEILFVPASLAAAIRKGADDFRSKDVFGGNSADVAGIEVVRGRGKLQLARKQGIWWIEEPIADLADRDVMDRLAGDLSSLRVTEFLPKSAAGDPSALGLAPPVFRVTLTDAKGAKNTLDIGSTRTDGNAVYATRQGQIFTIGNSIIEDLSKEATAFRDRRLVRFERGEVAGIETADGPKRHSFARKQAGWSLDGRTLLASAADDLMTAILDVESKSILDDAGAASIAGRPADWTVDVRMSAGPGWSLKLVPLRGDVAVTVSRRPGAFTISREAADRLRSAIEKAAAPTAGTPAVTPAAALPTVKPKK